MQEGNLAKEQAIEYCKGIRKDIKKAKEEEKPISKCMEIEFRRLCKISFEVSLKKYPELQAEVDKQKALEDKAIITWEAEVQKVMKKNNLTEEDIKEEAEE